MAEKYFKELATGKIKPPLEWLKAYQWVENSVNDTYEPDMEKKTAQELFDLAVKNGAYVEVDKPEED